MDVWRMSQASASGLLAIGMVFQTSPLAWAQIESVVADRDPILASTIEAAVKTDPDIQKDPELRSTVEQLTKECLTDPIARAEIAHEVTQVRAEGGVETVIPKEVLTAVRTETSTTYTSREADMRKVLEALPANSTERKMAELSMEHAKQVMEAYAKGEAAPPPPKEMVTHAQEMFKEWAEKSGASSQEIEMAKYAMERFAAGEMMGPAGGFGPGGGMGPGGTMGEHMGPPSDQQLKAMADAGKITPEQLATMQKDKAAWEAAANDPSAREALMQKYAAEGGFHQGFEGMPRGGFEGVGGPGGSFNPRETFGPATGESGFQGAGPRDAFERWAAEGHAVSPEQFDRYREIAVQNQREFELQLQSREIQQQYRDVQQQIQEQQQQQQQNQQQQISESFVRSFDHFTDHNGDGIPEHHQHDVFRHPDGTCHDHGNAEAPIGC